MNQNTPKRLEKLLKGKANSYWKRKEEKHCFIFREGITIEELKKRIKEEATKKLKEAKPKKVEPKKDIKTSVKPSPAAVAAKSQLPYDSSAPVNHPKKKKVEFS